MQNKREILWIQLPVRIEKSQSELLEKYAEATKISKSSIVRSALVRFIADLERSGVRTALERIHSA
jgi:hypothetical protein